MTVLRSSVLFLALAIVLTACGGGSIDPLAQTQAAVAGTQVALSIGPTQTSLAIIQEATQRSIDETATATLWTDTPTPVTRNADWTPVEQTFSGVEMVLVPAGKFRMGNDPDAFQGSADGGVQTFNAPFWISKHEVTNAEYREFIDAGGYDDPQWWTDAGWAEKESEGWTQPGYWTDSTWNTDDQPVVGVSWYEAVAYANWRGMRLPTEAEWEYAARGPDALEYPWGDDFVSGYANISGTDDGYAYTAPVGSYPDGASWVGALDLSGNVWEWTRTPDADYPYDIQNEVMEGDARRVLRGGSWGLSRGSARAAARYGYLPFPRNDFSGFRLVRPPSQ